jgi:hypothetical protein
VPTSARLIDRVRDEGAPLFAVLDAARDRRVLASLYSSTLKYESLYEGPKGAALVDVAPHLVSLPLDSPLLGRLAGEWWGAAFGVLLTSRRPFDDVRARLRRLLMVENDAGRQLYFRFYDPRVLRVFFPTATPRQVAWYFGGGDIDAYLVEDHDPSGMLVFTEAREGVLGTRRIVLTEEGGGGAGAL